MAALFYHNEDQKIAALQSKKEVAQKLQKEVKTEIMPLEKFYLAENYHQKYYLKSQPVLVSDLKAYYPDPEELTDSTVAARLNGIAGGFGDSGLLEKEIENYGLSPETREILEYAVY